MHPIQSGKTIEECTQLFDENDYENPTKASSYIYKAFAGDTNFPIDESLKDHIFRQSFVEMISRDKTEFEKTISLSVKKKINIESTYNSVRL
ncbi:MAG: hypothetical protein LBU27_00220 [Candidatus Peribacteria bacterium]|jgi:type I restriction enzyme M protein|nr:hypothetical protein [Candidatus Peribacteria bacterium]